MLEFKKYKLVYSRDNEPNGFTYMQETPAHKNYIEAVYNTAKNIFIYMQRRVEVYVYKDGSWQLLRIYDKI
jgi:hypothetical protein